MRNPRNSLGIGAKKDNSKEYMRLYQRWRRQQAGFRQQENEAFKKRHQQLRLEAIKRYSDGTNKCAQCEESDVDLLELDHIKEDGWWWRSQGGHGNGISFMAWLKRHNYPTMFQVLCVKCNRRKYWDFVRS